MSVGPEVVEVPGDEMQPVVFVSGVPGPAGAPPPNGTWVQVTQAEYDAIAVKDPNTLYVIVG